MRFACLLLALVFTVAALAPCVDSADAAWHAAQRASDASAFAAASRAGAERFERRSSGAPPCPHHAPPASVLKAPCPCGCGEHGPASVSLGSLGVALLPAPTPMPLAGRAADAVSGALASPRAPTRSIDKVPRAA